MNENEIASLVMDKAFLIHRELGPGLLESVYEVVMDRQLSETGLVVERQVPIPIRFQGITFDMDLLGQLPTPFSEIAEYGKSPKLPKTLINYKFAKLLETNNIISSASEKENHIKINTLKAPK